MEWEEQAGANEAAEQARTKTETGRLTPEQNPTTIRATFGFSPRRPCTTTNAGVTMKNMIRQAGTEALSYAFFGVLAAATFLV